MCQDASTILDGSNSVAFAFRTIGTLLECCICVLGCECEWTSTTAIEDVQGAKMRYTS